MSQNQKTESEVENSEQHLAQVYAKDGTEKHHKKEDVHSQPDFNQVRKYSTLKSKLLKKLRARKILEKTQNFTLIRLCKI